ncbi:MAG: 4-hydroxythreonine-4-phosphate dehydrogenase PdxA [Acidobacteriaceae bacterium]
MKQPNLRPTIVVTLGDPAGVGAEITLKALNDPEVSNLARWILIGDLSGLLAAEESTGVQLSSLAADFLDAHELSADRKIAFGELRAEYGRAAAAYVRVGTEMCLRGEVAAMVTAPLNKEAVTLSGMPFSGHTEYIAQLCGAKDSRMLLASDRISVVHVSTHTSLRTACNLNVDRIVRTIELGREGMRLLGHADPRIAVCGLNPHAGEHGLFGAEDAEFIAPAIEICRGRGMRVDGPASPDTIFVRAARGSHDLIVAMYHDQGHIPMKLIDFERTVNVSLGIPIIRTSVDHGTAFDIAGKNEASSANMKAAMKLATTMVVNRELHPQ